MTRVLDIAMNSLWAMDREALERLLEIAGREHKVDTEALAAYRADSLKNADRTALRDGVAIMNVEGALFPRANLMTEVSGATSYDILRRDLQAVLDAGKARALILNIDSPGGAVNGASEFAQALYEARGKLPIVAYVRGTGASAAYLIASAAHSIVVNDMAELGSLGVMATYRKDKDRAGSTTYTFISSQSPLKNADPASDVGAAAVQERVDATAQVFVETVARNRGVDTETALKDFGRGGILIGEGAVKAGLADAVGSFESVLADLASGKKPERRSSKSKGITSRMAEDTIQPVVAVVAPPAPAPAATAADIAAQVAKAVTETQAAERTRISGLRKIATAHAVSEDTLNAAVDDGSTIEAFALKVAADATAKTKAAGDTAIAGLKADETKAGKVAPSQPQEPAEDTAEAVAARILADAKLASGEN